MSIELLEIILLVQYRSHLLTATTAQRQCMQANDIHSLVR